jgi:alanine racemase
VSIAHVEISRENLLHNLKQLRSLQPKAKVGAVIKGNAYGHGQNQVAQVLESEVDLFLLDDLDELRYLRQVSNKPVMLLGYVPSEDLEEAVMLEATLAFYDPQRLPTLQQASKTLNRPAKVHLKIDAMLGRQGVVPRDLPAVIQELQRHPKVQVEGVYAHFGNIEDTTDLSHAQAQVEMFEEAVDILCQAGYRDLSRHMSSTSGMMVHERQAKKNDIVRLGIGLYGLYPSEALGRSFQDLELRPVMRWVTKLAQIKMLPVGHPVGYGLTYFTSRETRIGIVPQGYADGFDRGLSSAGDVLVRGKRCPVIGRVAMNMFAIDLNGVPDAEPEDEVLLLGDQAGQRITAEEVARRIGTINYEIVTRVSPLLPRVVV